MKIDSKHPITALVSKLIIGGLVGLGIGYLVFTGGNSDEIKTEVVPVQAVNVVSVEEPTEKVLGLSKDTEAFIKLEWDQKLVWSVINGQSIEEYRAEVKQQMERDQNWLIKLQTLTKKYPKIQQDFRGLLAEHLLFRSKILDETAKMQAFITVLPDTLEGYAAWAVFYKEQVRLGRFATAAYYTNLYYGATSFEAAKLKVRVMLAETLGDPALEILKEHVYSGGQVTLEDVQFEAKLRAEFSLTRTDVARDPVGTWKEARVSWNNLWGFYATKDKILGVQSSFPLAKIYKQELRAIREEILKD